MLVKAASQSTLLFACVRPAWFNGAPEIKIKSDSLRIVVTVGCYNHTQEEGGALEAK